MPDKQQAPPWIASEYRYVVELMPWIAGGQTSGDKAQALAIALALLRLWATNNNVDFERATELSRAGIGGLRP